VSSSERREKGGVIWERYKKYSGSESANYGLSYRDIQDISKMYDITEDEALQITNDAIRYGKSMKAISDAMKNE
jgi:hypothetical protein